MAKKSDAEFKPKKKVRLNLSKYCRWWCCRWMAALFASTWSPSSLFLLHTSHSFPWSIQPVPGCQEGKWWRQEAPDRIHAVFEGTSSQIEGRGTWPHVWANWKETGRNVACALGRREGRIQDQKVKWIFCTISAWGCKSCDVCVTVWRWYLRRWRLWLTDTMLSSTTITYLAWWKWRMKWEKMETWWCLGLMVTMLLCQQLRLSNWVDKALSIPPNWINLVSTLSFGHLVVHPILYLMYVIKYSSSLAARIPFVAINCLVRQV